MGERRESASSRIMHTDPPATHLRHGGRLFPRLDGVSLRIEGHGPVPAVHELDGADPRVTPKPKRK